MDQDTASFVVDTWSRGSGVVARGPKMLLSIVPAERTEVERLTGRRAHGGSNVWRLEVSGRFLASGGVVYPGGVPFPQELHSQTAVIANEVWLYADDDGDVVGSYWWPDAVRRPIASVVREDFPEGMCVHPLDAGRHLDIPVPLPAKEPWDDPSVAVVLDSTEVLVLCMPRPVEPLSEMLIYESGGLSVRAKLLGTPPDINAFLRSHQPPYRRLQVGGRAAIGRDLGRALGPQTWPWPGEVRWWDEGVLFEVKAFEQASTLVDVAESIPR